jgi:hypothetical protein
MASWQSFCDEVPEMAALVQQRFDAHRHKVLATLRKDGGPRISGIEASFRDGQMWLAGMPGSVKFVDLTRDPRFALHSAPSDPPDDADPAAWVGDAKVSGVAVPVVDPEGLAAFDAATPEKPPGPFDLFRADLEEAVFVRVGPGGDHLLIDTWHPGRGCVRVERR